MTTVPLDLPFKGERDYLHGTDLVEALLSHFHSGGPLQFQIHRMMTRAVEAGVVRSGADFGDCAAKAKFGDRLVGVWETNRAVTRRVEYDEIAAIQGAVYVDNWCLTKRNPKYTFVEQLVALNKKVLGERFPEVGGWVFVGLELDAYPALWNQIAVEYSQRLGKLLFRSHVLVDGELIGEVRFAPSGTQEN